MVVYGKATVYNCKLLKLNLRCVLLITLLDTVEVTVSYTNNTLYSRYKYGVLVKPFIAVLVLYKMCVLVLGEHLIYNGHRRAWASLRHWACIRLGHAIGPRHPSY